MRDVLTREDVDAVGDADVTLRLDEPRAAALADILDGLFVRHQHADLN